MFTELQIEAIVHAELHSLLWSEAKPDPDELGAYVGSFDDDYDPSDATPELVQALSDELKSLEDVEYYGEAKRAELTDAVEYYILNCGNDWTEAFGHDMALTRNGHGAGFWDRGLGEHGNVLTEWAKMLGTLHVFDEFTEDKADQWRGMFHAE